MRKKSLNAGILIWIALAISCTVKETQWEVERFKC